MNAHALYARIWERKLVAAPVCPAPGTRLAVGVELARRLGGQTLLDVGCGDGTLAGLAADRFDTCCGVELVHGAARRAAERGVVALVADVDRGPLPFVDRSFDLVTCLDVIEHVFDPRHLAREMARLLRPGGRCVVATPNVRYWRHLRRLVVDGRFPRTSGDEEGYDGGHLHYFTFADVEALLLDAGLRPVERHATYGGRGRRLPGPTRRSRRLQELLATGLFVVAQVTEHG